MKNILLSKNLILFFTMIFLSLQAMAITTGEVKIFIDTKTTDIINLLSDEHLSDDKRTQLITEQFNQFIDVNWMAKFTLGRHWKELSKEDSDRFIIAYKQYLMNFYIPNLQKYQSNILEVNSVSELRKNEFLVKATIRSNKDLTKYSIDFRLIDKNGNLHVFDILTEGVSIISTQRAEFNAIINKYGIDYLIEKLSS